MFLGIEIGGTKLQFGVGSGDGPPMVDLKRLDVDPQQGADRIRGDIRRVGGSLIERYGLAAVGIGFGGPVDLATGRTLTSFQVDGWDDFPLGDWCHREFNLPTAVANDSDMAGLAEARFGAGHGRRVVFYTNVGSGIGGALVIDGEVYRGGAGVASEIGHLRPGLQCDQPDRTLESIASGWGIAAAAQARLTDAYCHPLESWACEGPRPEPELLRQRLIQRKEAEHQDAADLRRRCDDQLDRLSAKIIARAAAAGNQLARDLLNHAAEAFAWGVAQVVTLLSPEVVVLGGGVSLVEDELFLTPLRRHVRRYVFPPLDGTFEIVRAELGEEVVVHGALALASGLVGSGQ